VRDKRLHKYYLNGNDAYRLKVWFNSPAEQADKRAAAEHAAEPGHEAAPTEAPAIAAI